MPCSTPSSSTLNVLPPRHDGLKPWKAMPMITMKSTTIIKSIIMSTTTIMSTTMSIITITLTTKVTNMTSTAIAATTITTDSKTKKRVRHSNTASAPLCGIAAVRWT